MPIGLHHPPLICHHACVPQHLRRFDRAASKFHLHGAACGLRVRDVRQRPKDSRYYHFTGTVLHGTNTSLKVMGGVIVLNHHAFLNNEESHRVVDLDRELIYVRTLVADGGLLENTQGFASVQRRPTC